MAARVQIPASPPKPLQTLSLQGFFFFLRISKNTQKFCSTTDRTTDQETAPETLKRLIFVYQPILAALIVSTAWSASDVSGWAYRSSILVVLHRMTFLIVWGAMPSVMARAVAVV